MAKQYLIENEAELRKSINRNYLIRLTFPQARQRIIVGWARFCELVGNMHAEHYAKKALKAVCDVPEYRGQAGRLIVTFYPR